MRYALKFNLNKIFFACVLLIILAASIWFLGQYLVIAGYAPFADPQKRLVLIATLILAWLTKLVFLDHIIFSAGNSQDIAQRLHALRGRFLGALRFLKKTMIDKHGLSTPLHKLPWYLLMGPPGAGKTTLLAYANIHYILAKQYKKPLEQEISRSAVCDWWVTRDLVLVDVPGCYAFSPQQECVLALENTATTAASKPPVYLSLWKSFLHLLTKYRQKNNIGAIVIALQLPELIKQPRQQQTLWFQEMKERLVETWNKLGKLPVYFIVTKCDLLPGFIEFFNDSGSDELTQPWGIPLDGRKEHENILEAFSQRFNALIKRLNKQLIWRLHRERSPQARPLIKDFPLQLEFLKETLAHLIKMLLAVNPDLDLEGIYLTSTIQENQALHHNTLFHHDLPSELPERTHSPFISRAYFIKQVITHILPNTSNHLIRYRQKRISYPQLIYALGFIALLFSTLWLGKDFQQGISQISMVQRSLSQYQLYLQQNNQQDSSLRTVISALPLLNSLANAAHLNEKSSRLQQIKAYYSQKSHQAAIAVYQKALQTSFVPKIKYIFEHYLQTEDNKNPQQLYNVLKAYLMLRHTDTALSLDERTDFIIQTLNQSSVDKSFFASKEIIFHLEHALAIKQALLNNPLIQQARNKLNALPISELAYTLLIDLSNPQALTEINLGTNIGTPPALVSKGTTTVVPRMFTAAAFDTVVKKNIAKVAVEALQGNEVLGKKLTPTDLRPLMNTLSQQLEKTYIAHYVDVWESLVDNISINSPKNLTETDAMILNLMSERSPLLQLLQTIHENTNLEPILANSDKLRTLNLLFDQTQSKQKDSLYQLFNDLHQLHLFLQEPSNSTTTQRKQLDPSNQIRTTAEKYPDPIKSWLLALMTSTENALKGETTLNEANNSKTVVIQNTAVANKESSTPLENPENSPESDE